MIEALDNNQIFVNELLVNSFVIIMLFSPFSSQNSFLTNKANAFENNLTNNNIVSIVDREKKKEEQKSKIDIAQESQKWEAGIRNRYKYGQIKTIDEGLKHISVLRYINKRPVRINVVEINRTINPSINLAPALATDNKLATKSSIRKIAQNNNSIIAINGSFFKPQNGIPLGSLMIDGKLLTGPMYNRVALGIFDNDFKIERVELNAKVECKNYTLTIDNINQPRMLSTYVLAYSKEWGTMAPPSPQYGMQVSIVDDKIVDFSESRLAIPENGYVIVGPKDKLMKIVNQGKVKVSVETNPNWSGVRHIISGGPYLVKNNQIYVDTVAEKLNSITGRNPRTAIGITADNNLVLVTVDGREESSVGMTLGELAWYMKSIGCVEAMNLDGGGSSIMYVNGNIVNNPSIKGGIALSNAFTVSLNNEKISLSE